MSVNSRYDDLMGLIPDPRMIFMNHGYLNKSIPTWIDHTFEQKQCWNLVDHCVSEAGKIQGKSVLDVGCGRGGATLYFSKIKGAGRVVGVDYSLENIKHCKRYHEDSVRSYRQVDADSIGDNFADETFDLVFNLESSHSYANMDHFLCGVRRILKPGGIFVIADCFGPIRDPELLTTSLKSAGFRNISCEEITNDVMLAVENYAVEDEKFFNSLEFTGTSDQLSKFVQSQTSGLISKYQSGKWRYFRWTAS